MPRPVPAVIAVALRGTDVLLVQRRNAPDAGLWGFPGGKIEPGETLTEAALRELQEETGLTGRAGEVITALDALSHAPDGTLAHHYVLIAVRISGVTGAPVAADDAADARWVPLARIAELPLSRDVARLAHAAV
ncbi:NUDIX hydrolase [Paenirhodobacter sp.]|uniref:NUDIX hydrolase n=1 Tax=Paenirhodobacter sp. TaxID=1965326 RepID=UPI003B3D470C